MNHHDRQVSLRRPQAGTPNQRGVNEQVMAEMAQTRRFLDRSTSVDVSVCVCGRESHCECVWVYGSIRVEYLYC